jgi:phage FluMu protein Com
MVEGLKEVRCPECGSLLFRARGIGTEIEVKCRRAQCGRLVTMKADRNVVIGGIRAA